MSSRRRRRSRKAKALLGCQGLVEETNPLICVPNGFTWRKSQIESKCLFLRMVGYCGEEMWAVGREREIVLP